MNCKNQTAIKPRKLRIVSLLMIVSLLLASLSMMTVVSASAEGDAVISSNLIPADASTVAPAGAPAGASYLSDMDYTGTTSNNAQFPAKDGYYKNPGQGFTFAAFAKFNFTKGIGTHPYQLGKQNSYIQVDISSYNADTFYAVFGLTDAGNTLGVVGTVYADGEQIYSTGVIYKSYLCEIVLDVTGVDTLRLVVESGSSSANSSCACAWADACVYNSEDVTADVEDYTYLSDLTVKKASKDNFGYDGIYKDTTKAGATINNVKYQKMLGIHSVNLCPGGAYDAFGQYILETFNILAGDGINRVSTYLVYDLSDFDYNTFYTKMALVNTAGSGGTLHVFGANSFTPAAYTTENAVNTAKNNGSDAWTKLATTPAKVTGSNIVDIYADIDGYDYIAIFIQDAGADVASDSTGLLNAMVYNEKTAAFHGTQEKASATAGLMDLRFVGSIYSLDHDQVGLKIERADGSKTYEIPAVTTVYTSLTADEETVTAGECGGNYLFTVTMKNVPASGTVSFKVTPYVIVDSVPVYGETKTVTYVDGALA